MPSPLPIKSGARLTAQGAKKKNHFPYIRQILCLKINARLNMSSQQAKYQIEVILYSATQRKDSPEDQ